MKKSISLFFVLLLLLSMCACTQNHNPTLPDENNTTVMPTESNLLPRDKMTSAELEEAVTDAAMDAVIHSMKTNPLIKSKCDINSTKYKIGSIIEKKAYNYEVNGILYLYNKYGEYVDSTTFTCSSVVVLEDGGSVSMGSVDIKNY